ncbi:hypothetical protein C8Q80DRAFT_1125351 [Daedaleopsis nitida]|nr:hypothetical protein C8Q80DRAFT_1125351 [Daedaleopsis nitida]
MPAVSRTHRAEAKYNVTLDFPNLGLHSAAAAGNLGLVTYALDHNQPVNSVLDGVLPLHVASSGGNDQIVRLLIERGADVNAPRFPVAEDRTIFYGRRRWLPRQAVRSGPRTSESEMRSGLALTLWLPRKYSSDRHKDSSAPIVGSSGATPLHFAAANGHETVVLTLLLHGAHPSRADKHGTTPAMLARQHGWTRVADLLTKWTHEKDRDLRERDALNPPTPELERTMSRMESLECRAFEKKVKVQRSIDNAINILRPTPSLGQLQPDASYTTSPPPIAEVSSDSPDTATTEEFPRGGRLSRTYSKAHRKHAHLTAQLTTIRTSRQGGRRSRHRVDPATASGSTSSGRLRGKISLLHMFKKASGETGVSTPATPEGKDGLSGYASSSSAVTSASPSPAPERERSRGYSPLRTRASENGPLSSASGLSYPAALATAPSNRSKLGNESETNADASFPPMALELHRRLSRERMRTRSGSGSSANAGEPQSKAQPPPSPRPRPPPQLQGHRSPPVRPGILRPHNRSASSGQSQFQPPVLPGEGSARSLRFESSSTSGSLTTKRSGLNLDLKASGSVSSLRGENLSSGSPRSPRSASSHQRLRDPDSAEIPARHRQAVVVDDEDEDGYGEVISPRIGLGLELTEGKSRLNELKSEDRQLQRQPSFSSQSSSAGSQLPSPTEPPQDGFDCPFSINRPPLQPLPPDAGNTSSSSYLQSQSPPPSQSRANLLGIHGVDNRGRGDSFGSMSTGTDASMPQTPAAGPGLALDFRSPDTPLLDLPDADVDHDKGRSRADSGASGGMFSERDRARHARSRTMSPNSRLRAPPLDIDIRAISSHAQAEALVQRAQKSILDEEDVDIELPGLGLGLITGSASSGGGLAGVSSGLSAGGTGTSTANASAVTLGNGRTPLSAKLAAYGESLAIERRFKEQQRAKESLDAGSRPMGNTRIDQTSLGSPTISRRALRPRRSESGVRNYSLEERERPANGVHTSAPRRTKQRRPHTADGQRDLRPYWRVPSPVQRQLSPGHQHSLSGSAIVGSRPSPSPEKNSFLRPPTSSRTVPLISTPSSSNLAPRIVRSRTPDPDMNLPSPVPSANGTFGVPLSRVSTAPSRHASPDIATQRSISEQERERARANKLTKMGLPTTTVDAYPRAHSPYGHARNGGGGSAGSARHRFGGLRDAVGAGRRSLVLPCAVEWTVITRPVARSSSYPPPPPPGLMQPSSPPPSPSQYLAAPRLQWVEHRIPFLVFTA